MSTSKPFVPSPQQASVLEWTSNGRGSAIVVAVAGAGKTTTLVELLKRTRGSVAFCAYNKKIANEIDARVQPLGLGNRVRCGTFHSFGYGALRRAFPHVGNRDAIDPRARANSVLSFLEIDREEEEPLATAVLKAIGFAKQRAIGLLHDYDDLRAWFDLVEHFGIEETLPEDGSCPIATVIEKARLGLRWSAENFTTIDFEDMIWLPLVRHLQMWQNDWILVDEAQDTNPARRALARMMLRPSGRAVFVGDPKQAIYGFTGADGDALDIIRKEFCATELPLTVTYRCPKLVVAEAQRWVRHIQAHQSAPEGKVRSLPNIIPEAV